MNYNGNDLESDAQWMNLPDYIGDSGESFLPVCDVSGSMYGLPMEVCVALGIYLSERNKSVFKDCFMTFSDNPKLQRLSGRLSERVRQLKTADWDMSTNLESVFNLLLGVAVKHKVPKKDMPTKILILSDMEFNECGQEPNDTAMNMIRRMYDKSGYKVPQIVFWNLSSRHDNIPVRSNEKGTALVSGFSPSIMKSLLCGDLDPMKIMMKTINDKVYDIVRLAIDGKLKVATWNKPDAKEDNVEKL